MARKRRPAGHVGELNAFTLVCLAAALIPASAAAGSADCLWNAVPESSRDAFFEAYPREGPTAAHVLTEALPPDAACPIKAGAQWIANDAWAHMACVSPPRGS